MNKHKGRVTIAGVEYLCEVVDGIRYIDGKTVEEFLKTLPREAVFNLAAVGSVAVKAERDGLEISPSAVLKSMEGQEQSN